MSLITPQFSLTFGLDGLSVEHTIIPLSVSSTLVFTQHTTDETWLDSFTTVTSTCHVAKPSSIQHTLSFTECLSYELTHQSRVIYKSLEQIILFSSTATISTGGISTHSIEDNIDFTEQINANSNITQTLVFNQTTNISIAGQNNESVSQTLTFTQAVTKSVIAVKARTLSQTLSFTSTVTDSRVRKIYSELANTLTFTQTLSYNATVNRSFMDRILFTNDYIRKSNPLLRGSNIGVDSGTEDNSDYFFPVAYAIKIQKLVTIQSPSGIITLPPPEWGDIETLGNSMNLKRSMNGKVYTYVKTSKRQKVKYTFKIGRRKALELRQFMRGSLATLLIVNNYWRGETFLAQIAEIPIEFNFESSSRTESGRITVELQMEAYKLN